MKVSAGLLNQRTTKKSTHTFLISWKKKLIYLVQQYLLQKILPGQRLYYNIKTFVHSMFIFISVTLSPQ